MGFVLTLVLDIIASWLRLLLALFLSIIFSVAVGIITATNKTLERLILPSLDVLQTIPILGFFPIVIFLIVSSIPGPLGINIAVVFLIFTSMVWNIAFGVYEAVKAIPPELIELTEVSRFSFMERVRRIYVPASLPRIAYQSTISFSIGLFYLVASEIFSTGQQSFAVTYGIGVEIASLAAVSTPLLQYATALAFLIFSVAVTRVLFLRPFSDYSERFSFTEESKIRDSRVLRFYASVYSKIKGLLHGLSPSLRGEKRVEKDITMVLKKALYPRESHVRRKSNTHIYLTLLVLIFLILFFATAQASNLAYEIIVLSALSYSFVRVWFIYILAVLIAIPVGIKTALSKKWFEPTMSLLQIASSIPAPILLPLVIFIFAGTPFFGELTALSIIFVSMIWYLLFSIISGVRTIPETFFDVASVNGLDWSQRWRKVYVPAMLPAFITGSITAIGGAWNSLIVAEYFEVQSNAQTVVLSQVGTGVGKLIDIAVFQGNLGLMLLAIASMTVMVIAINRLFWQKVYNRVTDRYRIEV